MNKIEMGKEYKTREGGSARLLCTDGPSNSPVIAIIDEAVVMCYPSDGTMPGASHLDLIEVRKKFRREIWVNVYPEGKLGGNVSAYISKETADFIANGNPRIACIPVIIEGEEGDGL